MWTHPALDRSQAWEVPARLPEPGTAAPRDLADVTLAMALEAARVRALFTGSAGMEDDELATLAAADRSGDLTTLWCVAVAEVCAAHRTGTRGEDDTFASSCAALAGWLTWCGRLPFAVPAALPAGVAAVYTEVLAAGR